MNGESAMAYYAYKSVICGLIPAEFRESFEASWKKDNGEDFDGTADYDGTYWHMAAGYIRSLIERIKEPPKTEPMVVWRGSVGDLATDLGAILDEQQRGKLARLLLSD